MRQSLSAGTGLLNLRSAAIAACCCLAALPGLAGAEEPWAERAQLTGSWYGHRDALAAAGISFDPYLVFDTSHNLRGGLDTQGSATRHLLSINATFDLATILGWSSGTVFADFHQQHGQIGSDEVGDYQYVGNWDADGLTQLSELWFEYELLDGMLRAKIGKVDANYEFAYSLLGWSFVHGSAGYPASNLLLPTYPDPATSVNLFVYPVEGLSLGLGVYDGALQEGVRTGSRGPSTFFGEPADLFVIGEVGLDWTLAGDGRAGRLAVGGWHHTGTFARFAGGTDSGTWGFHAVLEQMLWLPRPDDGEEPAGFDAPGIGAFVQYDWADPDVSDVEHHVNAGVTWRGIVSSREDDVAGVMLAWVRFSDDAGYAERDELAVEWMYKAQVTPAVAVQPYLQHVVNPGGAGLKDALNGGVRVVMLF